MAKLRSALEQRLTAAWLQRGALARALWPLAQLYRAGWAWQRARQTAPERLPVPVVVVGNVVAGGAGKTPTTLAIVQQLQARGWQPGIVSRGHGRRSTDCRAVTPAADPRDVGDEPLLLRRRTGVPVFVARQRAEAGRAALAAHPQLDILVCDDGLQHAALARDVEVCVFDARGVGNGWLLPAGPLREPWPRPVDLLLHTETPSAALPPGPPAAATFRAVRRLADHALGADGRRVALAALRGQPLDAVAGIARPAAFFAMLRAAGLTLRRTVALPDHYDFRSESASIDADQNLICTEKDALKLWPHAPQALAVPLQLDVPAAFFDALEQRLAAQGYHPRNAPQPPRPGGPR